MPLHGRRFAGTVTTSVSTPPLGSGGSGSTGTGGTSLADQAAGRGSMKVAAEFQLLEITSDKSSRVVFYDTLAHATADRNRKIGIAPKKGSGVQAEFLFSAPNETIICGEPSVLVQNGDSPQTDLIYYNITNLSGGVASITLTLDYKIIS